MASKNRKRSSAFDDFPIEDSFGGDSVETIRQTQPAQQPPQVERIERLKPSQMIPDRFQPRRLLPSSLRDDFFSGKLDCYQTAAAWYDLVKKDPGYHLEIDRLLSMGASFSDHGQIKPITGSWAPTTDGGFIFMIETGERRFWAACLRFVKDKPGQEPLLRVETVENPTRHRQVIENRHAEPPSSVSQACEIAALILAEIDQAPKAETQDEFDYFRSARSQRMPAGLWDKLKPIMQLSRPRMVQLLNILQFPSYLLDLADRYRLPERVLREILQTPNDQWDHMIRLSIQNQLTSDQVLEITGTREPEKTPVNRDKSKIKQPGKIAVTGIRRFMNAVVKLDEISQEQALDEVADEIVVSGQADEVTYLMDELLRLIQSRVQRM
ncbi:MAG: hypothetical protein JEZ06_20825 [Anaerolineaceae bacterium]|nr:hypothetical protein [Anaerolineaceae bacterium]